MKLWLLEIDKLKIIFPYDVMRKCLVRAETETAAREFAQSVAWDESKMSNNEWGLPDVWLDPECTTCIELTADGEAGVLMRETTDA